jgi:acetyltransferase-like isoleucine patch superfamily enzyme
VFVNSLSVTDHNLLTIGEGSVVGLHAHMSAHTVEGGVLKTAPISVGSHVTIGVQAVIEIGSTIGDHARVGALSFVPKHSVLAPHTTYVGAPVQPVEER